MNMSRNLKNKKKGVEKSTNLKKKQQVTPRKVEKNQLKMKEITMK